MVPFSISMTDGGFFMLQVGRPQMPAATPDVDLLDLQGSLQPSARMLFVPACGLKEHTAAVTP
jgi:hypothetical protein